ncbi:UNVERIFIED_CONTAM: Metal-dependent hydrolases of the beta-lactamase superfamily III [Acetivibrio alkalicellulosi]
MLNFLGIGSAFNTNLGNTCAYIKTKKTLFLIDCGSTVFRRLLKREILSNVNNIFVAITHTHPDHIGSLGELIFYSHYKLNCTCKIYFPDNNLINTILNCQGIRNNYYEISNSGTRISDMDLEFSFFNSSHVDSIPCYGILVNKDNKSIYYSGDSNRVSSYVVEGLKNGTIDKLYQDTCSLDYKENPHLYLGKLSEIIPGHLRHKVYCMHLDENFNINTAKSLGFNIAEI